MDLTNIQLRLAGVLAPVLLLSLVGCQPADGATSTDRPEIPSVRATLLLEQLQDGQNRAPVSYRETVAVCEAAGTPVKPLSDDQVAKLGTGKVELMLDAKRRLSRETTWSWTSPGGPDTLCQFEFVEKVAELYMDPARSAWSGDDSDPGWHEESVQPEDFAAAAIDPVEEDQVAQGSGWTLQQVGTEAGQACKRWRSAQEEACMWSGGMQAGFSAVPSGYPDCFAASFGRFQAAIPLHVEPLTGNGCRIRVQAMSVGSGTLPDDDVIPRLKARAG